MSVVGLDVGTVKLRAAVLSDGVASLVADATGATAIPAVVGMVQGRVHVGEAAVKVAAIDPAAAVVGAKGKLGGRQLSVGGYTMTPEQVVGVMVRHLVGLATVQHGAAPSSAVLCAPTWFTDEQREALEKGAALARLDITGTVPEPTAIAFHLAQAHVQGADLVRVGVVDIGAAGVSVGLYALGGGGAQQLGVEGGLFSSRDPAAQLRVVERCCRAALTTALLAPRELSVVYATGGGAHDSAARQQVRAIFGRRVVVVRSESAVALGAAMLGGAMTGEAIAPVHEDPLDAEAPPSSRRGRELLDEPSQGDGGATDAASRGMPSPAVQPSPAEVAPGAGTPASAGGPPPTPQQPVAAAAAPPRQAAGGQPPARPSAPNHPVFVPSAPAVPGEGGAGVAATAAALGQALAPAPGVTEPEVSQPSSPPGMSLPPPSLFPVAEILAGSHEVRNPTDPAAIFGLALGRKPTAADFDPVALPVLMVWVLRRKTTSGTLTVTQGDASAKLPVVKGAGYLTTGEHKALLAACAWPEATYTFDPKPPIPGNRMRVPMLRLAADGIRTLGRSFMPDQLATALGDRLDLAPVPRKGAGRKLSLLGLDSRETRLVRATMEGHDTARDVVRSGGAGEHTTLMLFILLTTFECLDWKPPVARDGTTLADQLAQRAYRMSRQNHFEALTVHWSAETEEIHAAHAKLQQQLARDGQWMKAAPEACAQMSQRVHEAYQVLVDPAQRAQYRREQYPDHDTDSLDDLLQKRISALGMKTHAGDEQRAAQVKRAELLSSYGKRGSRPVARPSQQPSVKPGGDPGGGEDQ